MLMQENRDSSINPISPSNYYSSFSSSDVPPAPQQDNQPKRYSDDEDNKPIQYSDTEEVTSEKDPIIEFSDTEEDLDNTFFNSFVGMTVLPAGSIRLEKYLGKGAFGQ